MFESSEQQTKINVLTKENADQNKTIEHLIFNVDSLKKENQRLEGQILKDKQVYEGMYKGEMRLKDLILKQKLIIDQMTKQDAFYVKIIETMCSVIEESI